MPFWYNEAQESKFAIAACTNYEELNSQIEFEELAIRQDDDFYYLFGHLTKLTDIKKFGNNEWKFEPQLMMMKFAKHDYEKYDARQKKRIPTQQHQVEKLACLVFDTYDESKVYSGKMSLQNGNIINMLLTKKDVDGTDMPEQMYKLMLTSYFSLKEVDPPYNFLPIDEIKLPAKSSGNYGGYGAKSQSEYERLVDRNKFVFEQINLAMPEQNGVIANMRDIHAVMTAGTTDIAGIWDLLMQMIRD